MVPRMIQDQDQDQDSLLVKRRNDNHSPGPVIRELVPSSHATHTLISSFLNLNQINLVSLYSFDFIRMI